MRLRPLSEAECYARCYGGHVGERIAAVRAAQLVRVPRPTPERLRELFEGRAEAQERHEEAA